jgi:hypothetical protein
MLKAQAEGGGEWRGWDRGGTKEAKITKHEGHEGWRRGEPSSRLRIPSCFEHLLLAARQKLRVGEQTTQPRLSRGDRSVSGAKAA